MSILDLFKNFDIDEPILPYEQHTKSPIVAENRDCVTPKDFFIISYPRSGNTWLRLMICDVLLQQLNLDTSNLSPEGVEQDKLFKISPTLAKVRLKNQPKSPIGFYVLKSHSFSEISQNNKFIYIYRSPADCLVSYFRYLKKQPIKGKEDELQSFCLDHLRGWRDHLRLAAKLRKRALIFSFENLLDNPEKYLTLALKFLGTKASKTNIQFAIENQSLEKQRSRLDQNSTKFKLAKGEKGGNLDYLNYETLNSINEYSTDVIKLIKRYSK